MMRSVIKGKSIKAGGPATRTVGRDTVTGKIVRSGSPRIKAVLQAAAQSGMLGEKDARIGGRVSAVLLEQARQQTGIETDTELIEFALASIALEDRFAETLRTLEGTVDPTLKLGY